MNNSTRKTTKKRRIGRPPKHGGYALLAGNAPLERRQHIIDYLTDVRDGLVSNLGPIQEDLTAAQLILIDRVISKLGVVRMMESHALEKGVMQADGLLLPCLGKHYLTYCNSIRMDLQALGVNTRHANDVIDYRAHIEDLKRKKLEEAEKDE